MFRNCWSVKTRVLVLAMDTSLSACSAAVWRDGAVLAYRFEVMERGQSEALMPMIADVMEEAKTAFDALDLIGVTVGPGAFTGLRIGLAAARGIGLGAHVPVVGVSTPYALAHAVPEDERNGRTITAIVDSKREDVFVQDFDSSFHPLGPIRISPPELVFAGTAVRVVAVGNGLNKIECLPENVLRSSASPFPHASLVASLAASHHDDGSALPAAPLYLRAADTTCTAPSGRTVT